MLNFVLHQRLRVKLRDLFTQLCIRLIEWQETGYFMIMLLKDAELSGEIIRYVLLCFEGGQMFFILLAVIIGAYKDTAQMS